MSKKGGEKKCPKSVPNGRVIKYPFFCAQFCPPGPHFWPPRGDPPKNPHFCSCSRGSGPQKGGFWGSENPPRRTRGARGAAPGISPPPPRAPRAAPRGDPLRDPPRDPPIWAPRRVPPGREVWHCMVVPMTWRSVGARTPCSSSRSPCGVSAARWSSTGHGDRSDLALRARPQDRHVVGRAARVVVGSDDSMSATLATCHPFVLACGHFGLGRRFASPLLPCRRHPLHPVA